MKMRLQLRNSARIDATYGISIFTIPSGRPTYVKLVHLTEFSFEYDVRKRFECSQFINVWGSR